MNSHWTLHVHDSREHLPPHTHAAAHLVVVIAGEFDDISNEETRACGETTVLLRACGETHEDRFRALRSAYVSMPVPAALLEHARPETITARHDAAAEIAAALQRGKRCTSAVVSRMLHRVLRDILIAGGEATDPLDVVRELREVCGATPSRALKHSRLDRACEELRRVPRHSLAEIAGMCGFYDQSHMTNTFRAQLGLTPLQYADSSKTNGR